MEIQFNDIESIKSNGFTGFNTVWQLSNDLSLIPNYKGVYIILFNSKDYPIYLEKGTGGFFKDKNPNINIQELRDNWIENSLTVYIGKAGGLNKKATLRSRLKQYFDFGCGKNVGHYGGRYIWQLEKSSELLICWKTLLDEEPDEIEFTLLQKFYMQYNKLPFANLRN